MQTVGLVGAGYWGTNYLRVFSEIADCELKWCADLQPERLANVEEQYPGVETTQDYRDILEDDVVDGVCIATPPDTHFELTKTFLEAGKDVLTEKPLTTDSESARELARIAEVEDGVLLVGHIYEYHMAVRRLREYILGGDLGNIHYFSAERTGLGPIRSDVSALWDLAVHDISIFSYLVEETVTAVRCMGRSFLQDVPDSVFLFLEFEGGTFGHVHCSWLHPQKTRKLTAVGDERMMVFNDTDPERTLQLYKSTVEPYQPEGLDEFHYTIHEGDVILPAVDQKEPLKVQTRHFLDCIESRETPLTGPREGARVVELLEAAEESLEQGGERVVLSQS